MLNCTYGEEPVAGKHSLAAGAPAVYGRSPYSGFARACVSNQSVRYTSTTSVPIGANRCQSVPKCSCQSVPIRANRCQNRNRARTGPHKNEWDPCRSWGTPPRNRSKSFHRLDRCYVYLIGTDFWRNSKNSKNLMLPETRRMTETAIINFKCLFQRMLCYHYILTTK